MVSSPAKTHQSVLIVDQSQESREVLRTILRRRGVHTYEADAGPMGLDVARECHPDVVVLDLDTVDFANSTVCDEFDTQSQDENSALVLLGSLRQWGIPREALNVVAKPYHYGPLIRKIEELLQQASAGETDPSRH